MNKDWVLTAGHCVKDSANPAYYTVTVGEHNVNRKDPYEVNHAVQKVVKHPLYHGEGSWGNMKQNPGTTNPSWFLLTAEYGEK